MKNELQPVVKWSGSKRSQAKAIYELIPDKKYDTYYEPFCGGCSMLNYILHRNPSKFKHYVASDKNDGLISLFNEIKTNPSIVSDEYERMWNELNSTDDKEVKKRYFENIRNQFNKTHSPYLFYFIMRTTTNGMPRYNRKGEFNNSFHVTRDGMKPETSRGIVKNWSVALNENNVEFINQLYVDVKPSENDFVYLDPPYANTSGMYYGGIDQNKLWDWIRNIPCDYAMSYDGIAGDKDMISYVPEDIYTKHHLITSGNSSFRRVIGNSTDTIVKESLYVRFN